VGGGPSPLPRKRRQKERKKKRGKEKRERDKKECDSVYAPFLKIFDMPLTILRTPKIAKPLKNPVKIFFALRANIFIPLKHLILPLPGYTNPATPLLFLAFVYQFMSCPLKSSIGVPLHP